MTDFSMITREPGDTRVDDTLRSEQLALIRHRVATRYYDEARVVDHIARALLKDSMHLS